MNNLSVIIKKFDANNNTLTVSFDADTPSVVETREYVYEVHNFSNTNIDDVVKTIAKSGLSMVKQDLKYNEMISNNTIKSQFSALQGKTISYPITELEVQTTYPVSNNNQEVML